jgi:hypothetical protein
MFTGIFQPAVFHEKAFFPTWALAGMRWSRLRTPRRPHHLPLF